MINSAHSKSSNSSGFNPILQKFYKMINEIIVSKTVCGVFLIFCWSNFINNFMVKNSFSEPKKLAKNKYLETHSFWKKFRTPFCRSYLYKYEGRILKKKKKIFFKDFFHDCSTTNLGVILFHKKIILYFFSRVLIQF